MEKYQTLQGLIFTVIRFTVCQLFFTGFVAGVALAAPATVYEQSVLDETILINSEGKKVKQVLSEIESLVDVKFTYNPKWVDINNEISVNYSGLKLSEVLKGIFGPMGVDFKLAGGYIILTRRAASTEEASVVHVISGKVIDNEGVALPGVNVVLKGTATGVVTDANGAYTLQIADEYVPGAVLVFSFIGYATQEVALDSRAVVDIQLNADVTSLNEVIVVGYGTQEKKDITTTVTHISGKDILQVAGNGALMAIQGKVAGLTVTNTASADPNSSPSFQLRGVSSRNAGLSPLFVINGIPGGNIDNLNQNDIESIDVLKGGAASAIYGTRGSNGVILITTKKGTTLPQAFYDGYVSFNYLTNKLDVLSRDQFLEHDRGTDFGGNTNWLDAVTRTPAVSHKQTLQLSGGSEFTKYMVSFDYRDAKGVDLRSNKQEYGARLNLNHRSSNNLYEVTVTMAPRFLKSNNSNNDAFTQSLFLNPTFPVQDPVNPINYFNVINKGGFDGAYNPTEDLKTVLSGTEGKYLDWSASFKLNITKKLYSQINLAQQNSDFFDFGFTPSTNTRRINGSGGRNTADRAYKKRDQKILEWIANYAFDKNDHGVDVMGGYSFNYFNNSGLNASNEQFPSDVLTYNNLGTGTWILESPQNRIGSYKNDSKLIAFFARVNYDFRSKYYLSASIRREGSSKFGTGNKWGSFPGVSVGWRIINESFFPTVKVINDLKLRADFGVTGNQDFRRDGQSEDLGSYLSLDTYSGYGFYAYQNKYYQVWGPSQNINRSLRWEKAENLNIGLDFELFDSKLSGSLNYFTRKNKDLLGYYNVPVPPNVQGSTYVNVGTMKNSGLEIQLDAQPYASGKFAYSVSFAGATNSNKFVSFSNDLYQGNNYQDMAGLGGMGSSGLSAQRLEEGKRIGSFYMLRSAGVDETGKLLVYNKAGEIIPGNTAKADDRQYVGNGLPKFTASLGNNFSYGNFTVSVFLRGAFGYDLYNTTAYFIGTPATQKGVNVLSSAYEGGKYAALTNSDTYSSLSDYFLEKGDYVKIDNVTLSYVFEAPVKYISSARIYFTGRNLHTFTAYNGGDPELVNVNGLTPGINTSLSYYPSSLQLIAGLQLRF